MVGATSGGDGSVSARPRAQTPAPVCDSPIAATWKAILTAKGTAEGSTRRSDPLFHSSRIPYAALASWREKSGFFGKPPANGGKIPLAKPQRAPSGRILADQQGDEEYAGQSQQDDGAEVEVEADSRHLGNRQIAGGEHDGVGRRGHGKHEGHR